MPPKWPIFHSTSPLLKPSPLGSAEHPEDRRPLCSPWACPCPTQSLEGIMDLPGPEGRNFPDLLADD